MFDVSRILAIPELEPDKLQMGLSNTSWAIIAATGKTKDGSPAKASVLKQERKGVSQQDIKKAAEKVAIKGDKPMSDVNESSSTISVSNGRNGSIVFTNKESGWEGEITDASRLGIDPKDPQVLKGIQEIAEKISKFSPKDFREYKADRRKITEISSSDPEWKKTVDRFFDKANYPDVRKADKLISDFVDGIKKKNESENRSFKGGVVKVLNKATDSQPEKVLANLPILQGNSRYDYDTKNMFKLQEVEGFKVGAMIAHKQRSGEWALSVIDGGQSILTDEKDFKKVLKLAKSIEAEGIDKKFPKTALGTMTTEQLKGVGDLMKKQFPKRYN